MAVSALIQFSCTLPPSPRNSSCNHITFRIPLFSRSFCSRISSRLISISVAELTTTPDDISLRTSRGIEGRVRDSPGKLLLEVRNLTAVITETKQQILNGVDLTIGEGEVHVVMGKNGSGKSTFSKVLVGHPDYEVTGGSVTFKDENLLDMKPEDRSLAGLFMSFQSPVEIPGVSNADFLNMAYNARRRKQSLAELGPIEFFAHLNSKLQLLNMTTDFLNRNVNEGFSGGEKKRNEILQLAVLGADLALLDEIDSGLDVDALQDVAKAVNGLFTPYNSVLLITHYQRLLEFIKPTYIHIMENGRIVKTGGMSLVAVLEKEGYKGISGA